MNEIDNTKNGYLNKVPWWIKGIVIIMFTAVICYKLLITPFNLQFDFPSFLALLLALFSVGLAALFYFKATETSNTFYDNTYKFTREIADLLVRIESGFGEKLRHLDEAYKGMQERFDKFPTQIKIEDTKKELKQEEKEFQKILDEREKIIRNLINKAQLRDEEKQSFLNDLKEKEKALHNAQEEIVFLRNRLNRAEAFRKEIEREPSHFSRNDEMLEIIKRRLVPMLGNREEIPAMPPAIIKRRFNRIHDELPSSFIAYLIKNGLISDERQLTTEGINIIKELAMQ